MKQENWVAELKKHGFKLTPLPPPKPKQMEMIQKINKEVCEFFKKLNNAHKSSTKSTLRFATLITHHPGHHSFTQKVYSKTRR